MYKNIELSNRFMFARVMKEYPNITKSLIEGVTGKELARISIVTPEKTIEDITDSKNIRLDVYVETADGKKYDVELQIENLANIPKRTRYYHAILSHDMLKVGAEYDEMKDSIVIFVCMFDPFGKKELLYQFEMYDRIHDICLNSGSYTYFVNATYYGDIEDRGLNSIIKTLQGQDNDDILSQEIRNAVAYINEDADWRNRIMTVGQLLKEEKEYAKNKGREEGKELFLEVIRLIKSGFTNTEISERVGVTSEEVETIRKAMEG